MVKEGLEIEDKNKITRQGDSNRRKRQQHHGPQDKTIDVDQPMKTGEKETIKGEELYQDERDGGRERCRRDGGG